MSTQAPQSPARQHRWQRSMLVSAAVLVLVGLVFAGVAIWFNSSAG